MDFKRDDKDLSVAYVSLIQKDPSKDTLENALRDATNITDEELVELGYKEAKKLYQAIIDNTFDDVEKGEDNGKK